MIRFEGTLGRNIQVGALVLRQRRQLDSEMLQMSLGDLLVQLLGKHVDADRVLVVLGPQLDLQEREREGVGCFKILKKL